MLRELQTAFRDGVLSDRHDAAMAAISAGRISPAAGLAVYRAGLGFEIQRAETGKYPEILEAMDPITGNTLIYESEEGMIRSAGLEVWWEDDFEAESIHWNLRAP